MCYYQRLLLVACMLPLLAGCSTVAERRAVFAELSPAPVSRETWNQMKGCYTGAVRTTARIFDSTGATVTEMKIEIGGTAEAPLIFLKLEAACSSAWNTSDIYTENFTNIESQKYGVRGRLEAFSHAPNRLLVCLRPAILSPNRGTSLLMTYRGRGFVEVESIGHFGRRGCGTLCRMPAFSSMP